MTKKYPKNWIKEVRTDRGFDQTQLADMVGTSRNYISMLENSRRRLYNDWVKKIAEALECHPLDITEGPGMNVVPQNDRQKEVLKLMQEMSDRDQEIYLNTGKAFISDKGTQTPNKDDGKTAESDDKKQAK